MLKGQVEFIVILGLIVVGIVAMYYALPAITTPAAPPAVASEQQTVKESVNNFIKGGILETIRVLGKNGGYTFAQSNSVEYLGSKVPFWHYRGTQSIPNYQQNFALSLTEYLRANKDSLAESLAGKGVTFGDPSVSVNILNSQIIATVSMPTSVKEYPIAQPYSVTIQSNMGEVYDFAKKFVNVVGTQRYFEYFTMSTMMFSDIEDNVRKVPLFIFLSECGDVVFKTYEDVRPEVMNAVRTTLAHTYLPGKSPTNVASTTSYPKYVVPGVDGKPYTNIDVRFQLPDGFDLTEDNFQMDPDNIMMVAEPLGPTGICYAEPVYVRYYLNYPVVVDVKDPLTGNSLRFAFEVFIKDNGPADYGAVGYELPAPTYCDDPACIANIKVVNAEGGAVPGAMIKFMGCDYRTDNAGVYQGLIPCGLGPAVVNTREYCKFSQSMSASDLYDATLTLKRKPVTNLYFHEVVVQNDSVNGQYIILPGDIRWLGADRAVGLNLFDFDLGETHYRMFDTQTGLITEMCPGAYNLGVTLSNTELTERYGALYGVLELEEAAANMHVYIPTFYGFQALTDDEAYQVGTILTNVLRQCNISPLSYTPQSLKSACLLSYGDVITYAS